MVFEAVGSFTAESVTINICKEVWSSVIGEVLVCRRDTRTDRHDPQCCCYSTCKSMTVVGYVHVLLLNNFILKTFTELAK